MQFLRRLGPFRKLIGIYNQRRFLHSHVSYSQAGEDRIIAFLFYTLSITKPTYLDIGANNPRFLSNTFYFYKNGSSGVCIEPNPKLWKMFKAARPRDIVLNVGIGLHTQDSLPFYCFGPEADGLSTFDFESAKESEANTPFRIQQTINVAIISANEILDKHFSDAPPSLLSIDVEGLDFDILSSIDFEKHPPLVICAETHGSVEGKFVNDLRIQNLLLSKGYLVYASSFINTIFLRKDLYIKNFS